MNNFICLCEVYYVPAHVTDKLFAAFGSPEIVEMQIRPVGGVFMVHGSLNLFALWHYAYTWHFECQGILLFIT